MIVLIALVLIGMVSTMEGKKKLIYNHTPSVPLGFYWLNNEPTHAQLTCGALIVFNVPDDFKTRVIERGWLNPGELLLKPIAAQSHDFVCTQNGVIWVNTVSYGRILKHDSNGRSMAVFDYCDGVKQEHAYSGPI